MSENPYAPPRAEVADVSAVAASRREPFFATSTTKLVLLTLCTLGIYEYYWFYKHWQVIRSRTHEDISPFWRAFFAIFFCHSLLKRVRDHRPIAPASKLWAGPLTAMWIVLTLLYKLPDPYWVITFASVLPLLPVQHCANAINAAEAPDHDRNARFGAWNWVGVSLGGPLFVLAIYGTFFHS